MTDTYTYQQHERVAVRIEQGPPTIRKAAGKIFSASGIGKVNNAIGLGITRSVGTMWCAYAFAIISLVSLPAALASGQVLVIVAWIAQTFLQLVLLPVIIVGQNLQAAASDDRAKATYDDAGAILEEAKQIQLHLATQDAAITSILEKLQTVAGIASAAPSAPAIDPGAPTS